jgi:zinc protease
MMMRWKPLCAGFTALFIVLAVSLPARAAIFEPETFTLDNGMQVVLISNQRAPVVRQMVWYKVGSADEAQGESGIAHLLEHLMFKGTENAPDGLFSDEIARNGGRENAFTSYDYTAYFQSIAKDRLELVMKHEADRMKNLRITEEQVAPERKVVLEERRSRVDNRPSAQLGEQVNAALYVNYPYRRPIIGWEHEIRELNLERILAFYRKYYVPNNAILIIEGDVTLEELKPLAEKYYGVIPRGPDITRERTIEPPARANKRVVLEHERATQKRWNRVYLAPSYAYGASEHAYALQVLADIVGRGSTSQIYRSLVVEQELALSAGMHYPPDALGPATVIFWATPREGVEIAEIEKAIDIEIQKILTEGVTEEAIARSKVKMRNNAIYARDDFGVASRVFGVTLTSGGTVADVENWVERIDAVTIDEIRAAADHVLNGTYHVTSELLPKPQS